MRASNVWKRLTAVDESGALEELRRNTILEIAAVIFGVAWVMMVNAYSQPENLVVPFILLGCSLGSLWLRGTDSRLALAWLIATLTAAIAYQKWLAPASAAQFAFPVVIVVSSLLVSALNVFVVAAGAILAVLLVAHLQGAGRLDSQEVVTPVLLILTTACAAWIGSRQMHLALDWMSHGYTRTNELLRQLREERGSLARTLRMLEDAYVRIEKMNYGLIEARTAAENARALKAEFAANISHELRTPLNLIIGFSETMANAPETYQGATWSPALRGDIEQIYQSSRHLAALIDDILDLSALDARRLGLTLHDAAIEEVLAEAVAMMQDLFHAKHLYLNIETEPNLPRVRIDATRIRQVLVNLLTNASRFTLAGGVTLRARQVDGEIEVAIQDTGVGIAPQDVRKVFEEFGQVDGSTTRKHGGTGLGVPLSKRLVELHGGRMWLESQPRVGTTFYFTLPVHATAHLSAILADPRTPGRTSRKTILVREPDPLLLHTMRRHLDGYDVIEVRETDDLNALIERHQPIALVVNPAEPPCPGPDDLPVIRVAMTGTLSAARALGVQDYLVKPVLREPLLEAMAGLEREVRDVLIVDDDPELVELLARMLQSRGGMYHPIKAFGGKDALARLHNESVDLVLLDLFMPEVDGMTMLKEMKGDPVLARIPVIVISAQNPELTASPEGLHVELRRAANASTTETLNYLQALIGVLPLRGLPATTDAPA